MDLAHSLDIQIRCRNDSEFLYLPIHLTLRFLSSSFHMHNCHYILDPIRPSLRQLVDSFLYLSERSAIFGRISQ